MLSTTFDRELLLHFVSYYIGIGVKAEDMYLVLHSEGDVQHNIDDAINAIGQYSVNYHVFTGPFSSFSKFEVLVCTHFICDDDDDVDDNLVLYDNDVDDDVDDDEGK